MAIYHLQMNNSFRKDHKRNLQKLLSLEQARTLEYEIFCHSKQMSIEKMGEEYLISIYDHNCKNILFNLENNPDLMQKVVSEEISVKDLAKMSDLELFPDKYLRTQKRIQNTQDAISSEHAIEVEGIVCRCGCKKFHHSQKQTRSMDEPMTQFYKCVKCGIVKRFG